MFCFFLSYKLLPLSDAVALGLSGPIFLTVLSIPFLGEKVGIRRWSAVIVGFLGVLLMTRPGAGALQLAAFVPLIAAVFYALAMISIRRLSASEPSTVIVFYFTLFATLIALSTSQLDHLGAGYAWVWPQGWQWGSVLLIGFMGGVGQLVIRSWPFWVLGKAITSRRLVAPAISIDRRSTPRAMPPCGGGP